MSDETPSASKDATVDAPFEREAIDPRAVMLAVERGLRLVHVDDDDLFAFRKGCRPAGRFRDGPWPGTGRKGGYRWFRSMRTRQELALAGSRDDDVREAGIEPDRAGRLRNPPTSWDDVGRHVERSWKRHRANRWRNVAG